MNTCQEARRGFFTRGAARRRKDRRKCLRNTALLRMNATQNYPRERGEFRCQRRLQTHGTRQRQVQFLVWQALEDSGPVRGGKCLLTVQFGRPTSRRANRSRRGGSTALEP